MTIEPSDTDSAANGPGVVLVVLRRGRTSTDVLLFDGDDEPLDGLDASLAAVPRAACLPRADARADRTQWQLAEDLLGENRLDEVSRLYASTLTVHAEEEAYGVFVGFVEGRSQQASTRAAGDWMDLREAIERLPERWAGPLAAVRQRFIARSPDEALRVR